MKLKIKDINPNPFKKQINNGKLSEESITKIKSNMKELGLMGSLPVYKEKNRYFLIAGHHRLEALKRTFGKDFEVEITLHDYSKDNVLRGMVIENLTQRADELIEITENINIVRNYLKSIPPKGKRVKRNTKGKKGDIVIGSGADIANWLNKNGEVVPTHRINRFLSIYDNLDKDLLIQAKASGNNGPNLTSEGISIDEATYLSRVDKKNQKKMKKIIDKTGLNTKEKSKLISDYIKSDKDIKKKVLEEEIKLEEIKIEDIKKVIKEKEKTNKSNEQNKKIIKKYNEYQREAENLLGKTNIEILKVCTFLNGLDNSKVLYKLDWKNMKKIIDEASEAGKNYNKFMESIQEKLKWLILI